MLKEADLVKLKEHSKLHKGGMSSKHMKNMKKFMSNGDSFSVAHQKAVELDKKIDKKISKPESGKNGERERNKKIQQTKMGNGLTSKQKKLPPQLKKAIKKKKAETKPKKRKVMNNPKVSRMSGY
jgi:hypothetical protein